MLTPRANPTLIGHSAARDVFLHDLKAGKLAHAWIFAGHKGIGKATLAYHLARMLLAGAKGDAEPITQSHPLFRRIVAGSHPDLLVLEPAFDDKKDEQKHEISVEQARVVAEFLSLTAGEAPWRVVIVDSADEMNMNAANAILKILEEPPPRTVLLLVSHSPGALLPTIRSRCRMVRLQPLSATECDTVISHIAPDISGEQSAILSQMAEFSPGVALDLHTRGAIEQYAKLVAMFHKLGTLQAAMIQKHAEQFGGKQSHGLWRLQRQLLCLFLHRMVVQSHLPELVKGEHASQQQLLSLKPASFWAERWSSLQEEFLVAQRVHLDYKTVTIAFWEKLRLQAAAQTYG